MSVLSFSYLFYLICVKLNVYYTVLTIFGGIIYLWTTTSPPPPPSRWFPNQIPAPPPAFAIQCCHVTENYANNFKNDLYKILLIEKMVVVCPKICRFLDLIEFLLLGLTGKAFLDLATVVCIQYGGLPESAAITASRTKTFGNLKEHMFMYSRNMF